MSRTIAVAVIGFILIAMISTPIAASAQLFDVPPEMTGPSTHEITIFQQEGPTEETLSIIRGGHGLCTENNVLPVQCVNLIIDTGTLIVIQGDLFVISTELKRLHNNVIWMVAHSISVELGYLIEEVFLTGEGTKGNPHSVTIVMTKYF